ncbi:hypothetical protein FNV43_RR00065 [Rhamnella rubrinervis]|uniref:Uncharacterized protein n=1 Tax=Rhamnella rubrinervis TaxID=2594499 RepID=A0A8K0MRN2_9ROSA|nr:hypothetical protein FNV43_RR00065 [Rhamnella rubrinervis]
MIFMRRHNPYIMLGGAMVTFDLIRTLLVSLNMEFISLIVGCFAHVDFASSFWRMLGFCLVRSKSFYEYSGWSLWGLDAIQVRMRGAVEVLLFTLLYLTFGARWRLQVCSLLILRGAFFHRGGVDPGYVKQTSIGSFNSCLEVWDSISCCTLANFAFDHHHGELSKLDNVGRPFRFDHVGAR